MMITKELLTTVYFRGESLIVDFIKSLLHMVSRTTYILATGRFQS